MHTILNQNPFIARLYNVLPREHMDMMMLSNKFDRSTVWDDTNKKPIVAKGRSSSSNITYGQYIDLTRTMLIFLKSEFNHIYDVNNTEPWQITRYAPGQQYLPHHDYFSRSDKIYVNDRIATVILYLNDDFKGGNTDFPRLNLSANPIANTCLYFTYPEKNEFAELTHHAGQPVVSGVKYIATLWIRNGSR